jgi:predicted CoA-binding protein
MTEREPGVLSSAVVRDAITEILKTSRVIAVVGLSSKPYRPSRGVAEYLQSVGYRIIPVNPHEQSVLGERSYARLEEVPFAVDIVNVFRRVEFVPEIARSAIRIGARALWLQEGVAHAEAAEWARQAGLVVIEDSCIMKEHVRRIRLAQV